jgi:hypothetical protein
MIREWAGTWARSASRLPKQRLRTCLFHRPATAALCPSFACVSSAGGGSNVEVVLMLMLPAPRTSPAQ